MTIWFRAYQVTAPVNGCVAFSFYAGGQSAYFWGLRSNNAVHGFGGTWLSGTSGHTQNELDPVPLNQFNSYIATFTVGGNVTTYHNLTADSGGSTSFGVTASGASGGLLCMAGGDFTTGGHGFGGIMTICAMWNRLLSTPEMQTLQYDPYSFLLDAEYELPVPFLPPIPQFTLMPQIVT